MKSSMVVDSHYFEQQVLKSLNRLWFISIRMIACPA